MPNPAYGRYLEEVVTNRSVTIFHDNARVIATFPGLLAKAS